jgi:hypothetical protein
MGLLMECLDLACALKWFDIAYNNTILPDGTFRVYNGVDIWDYPPASTAAPGFTPAKCAVK